MTRKQLSNQVWYGSYDVLMQSVSQSSGTSISRLLYSYTYEFLLDQILNMQQINSWKFQQLLQLHPRVLSKRFSNHLSYTSGTEA